jgi:hypothetical protein
MLLHPAKQFAFFRPSPVEGAGLGEEVDFQAVDAPAERPAEYVPLIRPGPRWFSVAPSQPRMRPTSRSIDAARR